MADFDPTIDAAFREYAELQLRRHYLLLEGKEDAAETHAAEDRMDELWKTLDAVQRRSLNGMGSDLAWVRRKGEPAPNGRKVPEDVADTEQQLLLAAKTSQDWHAFLHHLRICAPAIPRANLAYLRGSAYEAIGLPAYGEVFYEQAAAQQTSLSPRDSAPHS